MGPRFLGWNAGGGCCGVPAAKQVDDVGYIVGAAQFLTSTYGIDKSRIYAIGHSNGAMMAQRVMCETGLLAAEVAISGPLTADEPSCALARGKPILAIHGTDDNNVPLAGGVGRNGLSRVAYKSEADARAIFTRSGARYTLQLVPGVGHKLADLNAAIEGSEHRSIGEKAAAFFGLSTEKAAR
jgi:polyhydroxybutyrate depolymerase